MKRAAANIDSFFPAPMLRPRARCFLFALMLLVLGSACQILDVPNFQNVPVALADPPETRTVPGTALRSFPLTFDAEIVRLLVEGDSLQVEGLYFLSCSQPGPEPLGLLYPYPADSLMGEAHTTLLECRVADGDWQPLPIEEAPRIPAARWRIPRDLGPTLEVRTIYRQALNSHHARYIVTTTAAWGKPLQTARFEIHLPQEVRPTHFSHPFTPAPEIAPNCFVYEAKNFLPEQDIVVEWEP
jgi:hypothetical protein